MEAFFFIIIAIFVTQGFVFGGFCAFIAREKGREPINWFFLGLVFSLLAVLALIAVPKVDREKLRTGQWAPTGGGVHRECGGQVTREEMMSATGFFVRWKCDKCGKNPAM